jgi:hypothetical protein
MNKQTAVQWLYEQLWNIPQDKFEWNAILQQAKAMEKEQITQSFVGGADFREINKHHNRSAATYADQYYRTNFKAKIEW